MTSDHDETESTDTRTDGAPPPTDLEIEAEIGRGVESTVYRARRDGETVALKVVDGTGPDDASRVTERFHREATILATLDHPAFADILDVGAEGSRLYTVMEYIEGQTLAERLDSEDWSDHDAIATVRALAEGLDRVHRRGLVHRDIKPNNVVFDTDDRPKLIDFGLALRTDTAAPSESVAGTFAYSAPEQTGMLDRPVDGRADLYALGVVLFESVTGRVPFTADDNATLMRQHAAVQPPAVSELRDDVAPGLEAIITKLLSKDPDDRYQTCEGLVHDLDRLETLNAKLEAGETVDLGSLYERLVTGRRDDLVGRDEELARLRQIWERVRETSTGAVAVVEGEAGSGKSRLVRELLRGIDLRESIVVHGKCVEDDPAPFAPLHEALDGHLDDLRRLPADARRQALEKLRDSADVARSWILRFAPNLREALGFDDAPPPADADADGESEEEFFQALADFWLNLAEAHGGAVLFLDDLQWLDEASEQVLRQLVEHASSHPILVVATSRNGPEDRSRLEHLVESFRAADPQRIELTNFDRRGIEDFVANYLGPRTIPDDLVDRLYAHTDGSPFLVGEYLMAMFDHGLLRPRREAWVFDEQRLVDLELSPDVFEFVSQRISEVGDATRSILSAAALLGDQFDRTLLETVAEVDAETLSVAISQALQNRLIERTTGSHYRFVHDRIRESLQSMLDAETRRDLHQRAAEELDSRDDDEDHVFAIAQHYAGGHVDTDPERVVETNLRAGEVAMRDYAYGEAYDVLDRAHRIARSHGLEPSEHLDRLYGRVCARTGRLDDAVEHLTRAIERTDDPLDKARLRCLLAEINLWDSWARRRVLTHVRRGFEELGTPLPESTLWLWITSIAYWIAGLFVFNTGIGFGTADGELRERHAVRTELLRHAGHTFYWTIQPVRMAAFMIRAMYFAHRVGTSKGLIQLHVDWACVTGVIGWHSASDKYLDSALEAARETGDRAHIAHARGFINIVEDFQGRSKRSATRQPSTLNDVGRWLPAGVFVQLAGALSWNFAFRGYTRRALEWSERAERKLEHARTRKQIIYVPTRLASTRVILGQPDRAREHLKEAREIYEQDPEHGYNRANFLLYEAYFHAEQGDLAEAREAVQKFQAVDHRPGALPLHLRHAYICTYSIYLASVEAAATDSEREMWHEKFVAALDRLESIAGNHEILNAHWKVGEVARLRLEGQTDRALALANDVIDEATELDNPWVIYRAHRQLALLLRDRDQLRMARQEAAAAYALASHLGWVYRQRDIRAEFSLQPVSDSSSSLSTPGAEEPQTGPDPSSVDFDDYLETLLQISRAASESGDPRERVEAILDEVVTILEAERGLLLLTPDEADGDQALELFAARDADGRDLEFDDTYSRTIIDRVRINREPIVLGTTEAGRRVGAVSMVVNEIRSVMAAPLTMQEEFVGVIYLDSRTTRGLFTDDDLAFLLAIANHIPLTLETLKRARLESRVALERRQRAFAEHLRRLTAEMNATLDATSAFERLVASAAELLPHSRLRGFTYWSGETTNWVEAVPDGDEEEAWRAEPIAPDFDAADRAVLAPLSHAEAPFIERASDGDTPLEAPYVAADTRALLVIPIRAPDELLCGLLVESRSPDQYGDAEREIARTLATQAGMAIENVRLATRDQLTDLYNRRRFFEVGREYFERAASADRSLSAIILDVDNFKEFNDTHGHSAGDAVLRELAAELRGTLEDDDLLGRYGGEEFAVVSPDSTLREAVERAERLRRAVASRTVDWEGTDLHVTISLGVAVRREEDASLSDLLERADGWLYRAKHEGRDRVGTELEAEPLGAD